MLHIHITVSCPGWCAQGVKEYLAMTLETFGDVRVVEVEEVHDLDSLDGQTKMEEGP